MEQARTSWVLKAEALLRSLKGVTDASIKLDGDDVSEVHLAASPTNRPAKQFVRDVQTLLLTKFQRPIDYKKVSIVFVPADEAASSAGAAVLPPTPAITPVAPVTPPEPEPEPRDERIRFVSANLFVNGPRVQAQVELRWKGMPRMGSASGMSTREGAHRLVAQATLSAIQDFLDDDVALSIDGIDIARLGRRDVAVVGVQLIAHRDHKGLSGCCTVEQDVQQAVVLATLSAVNRVLGGIQTKEPTEYVLRPTTS